MAVKCNCRGAVNLAGPDGVCAGALRARSHRMRREGNSDGGVTSALTRFRLYQSQKGVVLFFEGWGSRVWAPWIPWIHKSAFIFALPDRVWILQKHEEFVSSSTSGRCREPEEQISRTGN